MLPFKLRPIFKDYIWGGENLIKEYNKKTDIMPCAESWELSAHKDGVNIIDGGEFDGIEFSEFIKKFPKAVSRKFSEKSDFPLLIKLIDAKENLSVQVHPDDKFAYKFENSNGKTEMWYVLDCQPDSFLYFGFRQKISMEDFEKRIKQNCITDVLRKIKVNKGDVFYIKSGTIHAIGKGIIIAEIQQNSNATYRVYDYGRKGKDGKERPLHIEKAKKVVRFERADLYELFDYEHIETNIYSERMLARSRYFKVKLFSIKKECNIFIEGKDKFRSFLCIGGNTKFIHNGKVFIDVRKGDSIFIPADSESFIINGKADFLVTEV